MHTEQGLEANLTSKSGPRSLYGRRFRTAPLGQAHSLLDHHKALGQQAQAGQAGGIGLQLLLHPCGDFMRLDHEGRNHGRRCGSLADWSILSGPPQHEPRIHWNQLPGHH